MAVARAAYTGANAIMIWIERTYHRRRRHAALGRLTPIEYEIIKPQTAHQAA